MLFKIKKSAIVIVPSLIQSASSIVNQFILNCFIFYFFCPRGMFAFCGSLGHFITLMTSIENEKKKKKFLCRYKISGGKSSVEVLDNH